MRKPTPTPSAERAAAYRAARAAKGLKRLEVYVHPDDREEVLELVSSLCDKRPLRNRTP